MRSPSIHAKNLDEWLVKMRRWAVMIVLYGLYPWSVVWLLIFFMPDRHDSSNNLRTVSQHAVGFTNMAVFDTQLQAVEPAPDVPSRKEE
jgi:hypothetical protein